MSADRGRSLVACSVSGCGGTVIARGWCQKHYSRWRRHGDPVAGNEPAGTYAQNRVRRFTPELWEKWRDRSDKDRLDAPRLRAGIEQLRVALETGETRVLHSTPPPVAPPMSIEDVRRVVTQAVDMTFGELRRRGCR